MSKFCKKCGTQIADDIEFCPKCGISQNKILSKEEKIEPVKIEPGSAYSNSIPVTNESSKSIPTYVISIIAALVMVMGAFFIVFHGDIGEVKALFSSNVVTSEEAKPTVSDHKNNESSKEKQEKSNDAEITAVKNTVFQENKWREAQELVNNSKLSDEDKKYFTIFIRGYSLNKYSGKTIGELIEMAKAHKEKPAK